MFVSPGDRAGRYRPFPQVTARTKGNGGGDIVVASTALFTDAGYTLTVAARPGQTVEWFWTGNIYGAFAAGFTMTLCWNVNGTDLTDIGQGVTNYGNSTYLPVCTNGYKILTATDVAADGTVTVKLRAKGDGVRSWKIVDSGGVGAVYILRNMG